MINKDELSAMISLLDDPDNEVNKHVRDKLMSYGPAIIPSLENVWESTLDAELQQKIEEVIHHLQFETLLNEFENWVKKGPDASLLEGALLINKYQYPEIDEDQISEQINSIKRDIWLELSQNLTPLEQINVFNQIFYGIHKFKGDTKAIQEADNHYLTFLLNTRKGNPVSLGILYQIVAQELSLPVYGVDMPHHYILLYNKELITDFTAGQSALKKDIQFYINPFNKGMIFTRNEISLFLKKVKMEPREQYFLPCDSTTSIRLLLDNLIYSYEETKHADKIEELNQLRNLLKFGK